MGMLLGLIFFVLYVWILLAVLIGFIHEIKDRSN